MIKKSNKLKLVVLFTILIVCAILLAIFIPFYNSKKFDNYGKEDLMNYLNNIADDELKQNEINKALEKGWITEKDLQ